MQIAWFVTPYKQRSSGGLVVRYCAMDDLTKVIRAQGGNWHSIQRDADRFWVAVRAPKRLLTELQDAFPYATPQHPHVPEVERHLHDEPRTPEELQAWSWLKGLYFGKGYRPPQAAFTRWARYLAHRRIKIAEMSWDFWVWLCRQHDLRLFAILGAFPVTGILDDFSSGAGTLEATANWEGVIASWFTGGLSYTGSGTAAPGVTGSYGNYWTTSVAQNSEAYAGISTLPGVTGMASVWLRTTDPGGAVHDGYHLLLTVAAGPDSLQYFEWTNGGPTQVGATETQNFGSGDSLGLEAIGTSLQAYRKTGGSWSAIGSAHTDSAHQNSGYIGLSMDRNSTGQGLFEDFGGGAITAGGIVFLPVQTELIPRALQMMIKN